MESMDGLMLGMFVAGIVMSAAPIALGVWIVVFLLRELRRSRTEPEDRGASRGHETLPERGLGLGESP
jgi:uncharacterized membrane protein